MAPKFVMYRGIAQRGSAVLRRSVGRQGRRLTAVNRMIVQHRTVSVAIPQIVMPTMAEANLARGWELGGDDDDGG